MIRAVFKFLFKSVFWICALLGALIVGAGLFAYFAETQPKVMPVPNKAVLTVELEGGYVENGEGDLFQELFMGRKNSLFRLTNSLHEAARDSRVRAVLIYMTVPELGWAQIQELRGAIHTFRDSGKKVYFYTDSLGYGEFGSAPYYLAAACDEVWIQPMGSVGLTGLRFESPYLKNFFEDLLGVQPEFGIRKEYKSAPEMYTRAQPSEANTEAMQAIADSIMDQLVEGIAKDRGLLPNKVQQLIDEGPYLGQAALKAKLIDRMVYRPEIKDLIKEQIGGDIDLYDMDDYAQLIDHDMLQVKGEKVAVIFDSGMILSDGYVPDGSEEVINNDTTNQNFMSAINDPDVKAIVYRVNSPGGDPVASQTISHIIQYAKLHDKPVVVSMSNLAASGGYWISCVANKIVAQPATLTGSIGVFAGKFSLKGLWEKLGVNWGAVTVGENGGMWSFNDGFSPQAWVRMNEYLNFIYKRFVSLVAGGRNMPPEDVEKVARGRVWTGEQALALGLVDQLGGLHDAIVLARQEAGLPEDTPFVIVPRPKTLAEKIMEVIAGEDNLRYDGFLKAYAAPVLTLLRYLNTLSKLMSPAYSVEADMMAQQGIK